MPYLLFIGCAIFGAVLLRPVRLYLAAAEVDISRHCAVVVGIWLFAVTGLLILMAPQVWMTRIGMLFMCSFFAATGSDGCDQRLVAPTVYRSLFM